MTFLLEFCPIDGVTSYQKALVCRICSLHPFEKAFHAERAILQQQNYFIYKNNKFFLSLRTPADAHFIGFSHWFPGQKWDESLSLLGFMTDCNGIFSGLRRDTGFLFARHFWDKSETFLVKDLAFGGIYPFSGSFLSFPPPYLGFFYSFPDKNGTVSSQFCPELRKNLENSTHFSFSFSKNPTYLGLFGVLVPVLTIKRGRFEWVSS